MTYPISLTAAITRNLCFKDAETKLIGQKNAQVCVRKSITYNKDSPSGKTKIAKHMY